MDKTPKYNEVLVTGDDFDMPLKVQQEQEDKSFLPVDLTGYTVHFILATDLEDTTVPTIEDVVTVHTDPTNGETMGTFTYTETAALSPGEYYLIYKWITDGSKRLTLAEYILEVVEKGKEI